ncbi:unnamed protein product [Orchesella dallaii]|uniref:Major facilitator superfamily domain-containing protein 6 n=1 Tax=Orchesella dallaii TaxID=48710 RepID=A0ABP1R4V8_9HEXA
MLESGTFGRLRLHISKTIKNMDYHPLVSFIINFLDSAIILGGITNFLYNRSVFGGMEYTAFILTLVIRFLVAPLVPLIIFNTESRALPVLNGLLASILFFIKPLFPENGFAEIMIFGAGILLAFPAICADINAVQHPPTNLGIALSGKILGIFIFAEDQRLFGILLSFGLAGSENLFILYGGLCIIIGLCGAFIWSPSKEDRRDFVQDPVLNPDVTAGNHSESNELERRHIVMSRLRWINFLVYLFCFPDLVAHLYSAHSTDALHWGVVGTKWIFFIGAAIMPIYIGYLYNRKQTTKALTVFCWSFPIVWTAFILIPIIIAVFFTIMITIFEEKFETKYFTHTLGTIIYTGSPVLAFLIVLTGSEFVTLAVLSQVFKRTSKMFASKFSNLLVIRGAAVFLHLILFNGIPFLYHFLFVHGGSERGNVHILLAWVVMRFSLAILATFQIVRVARQMIATERKLMQDEDDTQNEMQSVAKDQDLLASLSTPCTLKIMAHPLISFIINFLEAAIVFGGILNFLSNKSALESAEYECFLLTLVLRFLVAPVGPLLIQKIGCRVLIVVTGALASLLLFIKLFYPHNGFAEIMIFGAAILLTFPAFCSDMNTVQHTKSNLGIALSGKVLGVFISTESQRLIRVLSFAYADSENLFVMYAVFSFIITLCAAFIWSPDASTESQPDSQQSQQGNIVMSRLRWINFLTYLFYFPDGMFQLYSANLPYPLHWGEAVMYWIFFIAAAILPIYIGHLYSRKNTRKGLTVFCWSFPIAWAAIILIPIVVAVFVALMLTTFEGGATIIDYFLHTYAKLVGAAGLAFFMLVTGCELVTLVALSQMFSSTSKLFMEKYASLWVVRGAGLFLCLIVFGGVPFLYRILFFPHPSVRTDSDNVNASRFILACRIVHTILELCATIKIVQVVREMISNGRERYQPEDNAQNEMETVRG